MIDEAFGRALVAELARKTSVSWVRYDGRSHSVWHVWHDDSLCVRPSRHVLNSRALAHLPWGARRRAPSGTLAGIL